MSTKRGFGSIVGSGVGSQATEGWSSHLPLSHVAYNALCYISKQSGQVITKVKIQLGGGDANQSSAVLWSISRLTSRLECGIYTGVIEVTTRCGGGGAYLNNQRIVWKDGLYS